MSEAGRRGSADASPFETLDPKLTVFALANGTDLAKGEGYRRLEWFTEGFERGILIEVNDEGTFDLHVLCWKTGQTERLAEEAIESGREAAEVGRLLDDAIEKANRLKP